MMKEQLRIADLCQKIRLAFESIKALFAGKTLTKTPFLSFQRNTIKNLRQKM
jgi:hypothetical protein